MRGPMLMAMLALAVVSGANITCPDHRQCRCVNDFEGHTELYCPPEFGAHLFTVKIESGRKIEFTCFQRMSWTDYDLLKGLRVGPTPLVNMQLCPLPNGSMRQLLDGIGASGITFLAFRNANLTDTVQPNLLTGLESLKTLVMDTNEITELPPTLFQNTTSLTMLDLKLNNLNKLPPHIFDSLSNLTSLELGGNRLAHLEPGMFRNLTKLRRLHLWTNRLHNLTRHVFDGLTRLELLDLGWNFITTLPVDAFDEIPQLGELNLSGNNFTSLPEGFLTANYNLTKISLFDNRGLMPVVPAGLLANKTNLQEAYLNTCNFTQIPGDIFWGSSAIKNISLQGNSLTSLPAELFRDNTNLKTLRLGQNQLTALPDRMFSTLGSLEVLDLSNNRLYTLPEGLLIGLGNLKVLDLGYNLFVNITGKPFRDLEVLEWLSLEHNRLQHMTREAFSDLTALKHVVLSYNQLNLEMHTVGWQQKSVLQSCILLENIYADHNNITAIQEDWVLVMPHLQVLDLRYNQLSYVDAKDLHFLSDKITVDLRYNNIVTVNLKTLSYIASQNPSTIRQREIYLDENPLVCDCQTYDLLRYFDGTLDVEARSLVEIIPGNLTCVEPKELAGIRVTDIPSSKLTCVIPRREMQDCPEACVCYMRPSNRALVVDCSHRNLTKAPDRLPHSYPLNHTELWLSWNRLASLPLNTTPGYGSVTHLLVSHNNISTLTSQQLPANLTVLELDHNNFTHLDDSVVTNMERMKHITLQGNPWNCDCDNRFLVGFVQQHYMQVFHISEVVCGDGSQRSFANLTTTELCPVSSVAVVAVSVTIALLGIMVGLLAALYYYYQREVKVWLFAKGLFLWFVTEEELDKEKLYDAFISYSHRDEEFVVNQLVPELESGPTPFKLCLHYRDWIAGEWIPNQIARSVDESRRTLVVLSPNFLESVWGRMEFRTAHSQALSEGRARVIVLLFGDVGPLDQLDPELRAYLSMNTYVKWGDPWFWDKLRYALPHPQKSNDMELRSCRTSRDDKLELINPSSLPGTTTTTPPTDTIVNPLEAANGRATLVAETNGHVNMCFVKSA